MANCQMKKEKIMHTAPCAKINLGLNVVSSHPDGYHNLETVFYPVPIFDSLSICEAKSTRLTIVGHNIEGDAEQNLVMRAYRMLEADFGLPPVSITLDKQIPMQAGMGGGSSDGAFTLTLLNSMFAIGLSQEQLCRYAARLGADCPFFITAKPAYAEGIGDKLTPVSLTLANYYLAIVKPPVAVSTREAYAGITPRTPAKNCREIVKQPVSTWRNELLNDFEESIFSLYPEIAAIKQRLYDLGADYAIMSGSGSSVVGLFEQAPSLEGFEGCFTRVVRLSV